MDTHELTHGGMGLTEKTTEEMQRLIEHILLVGNSPKLTEQVARFAVKRWYWAMDKKGLGAKFWAELSGELGVGDIPHKQQDHHVNYYPGLGNPHPFAIKGGPRDITGLAQCQEPQDRFEELHANGELKKDSAGIVKAPSCCAEQCGR